MKDSYDFERRWDAAEHKIKKEKEQELIERFDAGEDISEAMPAPTRMSTLIAIQQEVANARAKYPSNAKLLYAFMEEAGEVTKAFLDMQQKGGSASDVRKELIQAAAMAIRLLEEGDPDFPEYLGR